MPTESKRFDVANAARLDAPERLEFLPPAEVMAALAIQPNDSIADIGPGTGYFALPMAGLAPNGAVYAVDAQDGMLDLLRKKITTEKNIHLVHAEGDSTSLKAASCSLALLANIWHEFEDHGRIVAEVKRILKPGGRVAILDWRPDVERVAGPQLDHRLPAEDAMRALANAGFSAIRSSNIGLYSWLVQASFGGV